MERKSQIDIDTKFYNTKTNEYQGQLRCEEGEDLQSCILRLSERGWQVDAQSVVVGKDGMGTVLKRK